MMALMMALAAAGAGCGTEEAATDLTDEELLAKLAGRPLTSIEVEQQLATAELVCGFDQRVLERIWEQLDARQLEFMDFVFGRHCPERLQTYVEARPTTGTVSPAVLLTTTTAEPSTTTTTTTTTRRTTPTTKRTTTRPATTDGDDGDDRDDG